MTLVARGERIRQTALEKRLNKSLAKSRVETERDVIAAGGDHASMEPPSTEGGDTSAPIIERPCCMIASMEPPSTLHITNVKAIELQWSHPQPRVETLPPLCQCRPGHIQPIIQEAGREQNQENEHQN